MTLWFYFYLIADELKSQLNGNLNLTDLESVSHLFTYQLTKGILLSFLFTFLFIEFEFKTTA